MSERNDNSWKYKILVVWSKVRRRASKNRLVVSIYECYLRYKSRFKAKELEKCIEQKKFNSITYNDIYAMSRLDSNRFENMLDICIENAKGCIRKKEKIRVGFLVYCSAIWQYDALYKMLDESTQFEPVIVLVALNDGTPHTIKEQYYNTKEWFQSRGYHLLPTYFEDYDKERCWSTIGCDVIFPAIPYISVLPAKLEYGQVPVNSLLCYMPYGVAVNEMSGKYFNLKIHNVAWKLFYETVIHKDIAKEYSMVKARNVLVSGYAKMDALTDVQNEDVFWKTVNQNPDKVLKIIYAPHHSLARKESKYSTFDMNYQFFLDCARKYPDTTSWIIKPHPLLKRGTLDSGLFEREEQYDDYLNEWNSLPNARVVLDGEYMSIFHTSDTMILDSESFLLEYQYTHKPLLFLRCETQTFNDFGRRLCEVVYTADGDDFEKIEQYIKDIMSGKDEKKEMREAFFEKYLDYQRINGMNATEYIFNTIKGELL